MEPWWERSSLPARIPAIQSGISISWLHYPDYEEASGPIFQSSSGHRWSKLVISRYSSLVEIPILRIKCTKPTSDEAKISHHTFVASDRSFLQVKRVTLWRDFLSVREGLEFRSEWNCLSNLSRDKRLALSSETRVEAHFNFLRIPSKSWRKYATKCLSPLGLIKRRIESKFETLLILPISRSWSALIRFTFSESIRRPSLDNGSSSVLPAAKSWVHCCTFRRRITSSPCVFPIWEMSCSVDVPLNQRKCMAQWISTFTKALAFNKGFFSIDNKSWLMEISHTRHTGDRGLSRDSTPGTIGLGDSLMNKDWISTVT
jgi:hypothetical protein